MRRFWMCAALALAAAGCVTVNASELSTARASAPVPQDQVQVYFADDEIPEHERIAILSAEGSDSFTNRSDMIDKLREEAGKRGANAIVLGEIVEPTAGDRAVAAIFGSGDLETMRAGGAVAIYVLP